ncbi:hypothetical protein EAF04_009362 [Stromatinia cepivora]|nr:hypothetical protein EAF04_009362 [Stromatinia cepivora]
MSLWDYIPLPPYEDGTPSFRLGLEEIVYLQQKQVILDDCVKGEWKINAACLNMSFCKKVVEASSGRASSESINFFETIVPIDASALPSVTVPESTLSIPALLYIGWTDVAAEEIFECWKDISKPRKNCEDRDPSFIDYAISRVYTRRDSFTSGMLEKLNARKEMIILGLSRPFQDEILDRDNNHPGGYVNTTDLHDWIIDKMGKRYRLLVIHLRYLKNYAATGVQAERRITDETLQKDSINFPFRKKELPENKHFEEACEYMETVEAADHVPCAAAVDIGADRIRSYNVITSDIGTSIEEALLKGDPNHVQRNDFAEEQQRPKQGEYLPGLRLYTYKQKVRTHHIKQNCLY